MEHPGLRAFERKQMRKEYPYFQAGDTVRVNMRVIEGEKERIQAFEGVVISRSGGGLSETFTVRKISYGTGVERTFPLHSPRIESVKVVRRGRVRRAKLYYLRERIGKATRIQARRRQFNNARAMVSLPEEVVPVTEDVTIEDMAQDETQVEAAAEQNIETANETEAVAPDVETPAEESNEDKQ